MIRWLIRRAPAKGLTETVTPAPVDPSIPVEPAIPARILAQRRVALERAAIMENVRAIRAWRNMGDKVRVL